MNMLSLTFRGPFLFEVPPPKAGVLSPVVNIYAPQCDAHLGNLFYGNRSVAFYGSCAGGQNQAYVLQGQTPLPGNIGLVTNAGKISYQWDAANAGSNSILTPDNPPVAYSPKVSNCYFMITVPRPTIFYGLDWVKDTEVVPQGSAPTHVFGKAWSTAFRLYYRWDLVTPILLQRPPNESPISMAITPPAGAIPGAPAGWLPLSDCGDIELQFEGPEMSDPDHQDASACFSKIVQLAGIPWWLNFSNGAASGGAAFRTGSDCNALPVVIGFNN